MICFLCWVTIATSARGIILEVGFSSGSFKFFDSFTSQLVINFNWLQFNIRRTPNDIKFTLTFIILFIFSISWLFNCFLCLISIIIYMVLSEIRLRTLVAAPWNWAHKTWSYSKRSLRILLVANFYSRWNSLFLLLDIRFFRFINFILFFI